MVKLYRCEICGDAYIGAAPPANCPFCGAHIEHIKEAKEAQVNFDVDLSAKDRSNAEHALGVEISNSSFYMCAAGQTDDPEGKILFKALGKIEAEHASIWRKILKLESVPPGKEACHVPNVENLKESHARETRAIEFYRKAAAESDHPRLQRIFDALVDIETDHLRLSEERLK
ncbi:MAG TPA: ferritin family protein [Smithellaceae bacterium]|jgi:rubrerythrin|nr:ferritin family protein [Smithellaceae bacterium]